MDKYMLYEALCRLIRNELSILEKVDMNSTNIMIDGVKISKSEFEKMLSEFQRITSNSSDEYFDQIKVDIIPVKLECLTRFKSIQVILNKVREIQAKVLYVRP